MKEFEQLTHHQLLKVYNFLQTEIKISHDLQYQLLIPQLYFIIKIKFNNGITFHKFCCTIHCSIKFAIPWQFLFFFLLLLHLLESAFKSASIAICFPGIASRVNLAATSDTLPAPLVITIRLIIAKIAKTKRPAA